MFEKKRGKRFFASVMALVMLLSLAPVGALAAGETPITEESPAVALPANEANPKSVVTDEENTENTNEEPTTPPRNEGDTEMTADNNDIAEHKGGNKGDREPVTTDSTTKYVIRFYVSQTGTENSYTEENKYTVANQPDSNTEEDNLELSVSPGYAILTGYNDVATRIDWQNFTQVNETGDEAVKAWLNQHASKGVPEGLTNSNNVEEIVNQVNMQYQQNNKGYNLPQLKENYFTGFEFVEAKYVGSGESSIHVHVKLIRNPEYVTRTVHYMANDGTNREDRDSDFYEENTTATATVKENMFTRAGYEFTGWNTQEDGKGTDYSPKTSIQFDNHTDVTLYAQWEAKKYKVSYDLNYTDATNSLEAKTDVKWGDNNLLPDGSNPIRDGYSFAGWYTQATAGTEVTDVTTYASIAGNDATPSVTLYAHWNQDSKPTTEPTPVYVYFKIVDAAGNNIKDKSKINNDDLKNTAYNNDADKKTWATLGKIASAETLTDGTEYTGTNTTLVTVGNEAKNQLKGNALYKDNTGIATTVLANIEWFQLKQWNGATDYVLGGSRWHLDGKITGYTVTYDKGTTEATNDVNNMPVPDKMYYLRGSEYTVSDATPTREGYVFTGWKSDNNVYASESKMTMPAKNVVLTAQWAEDNWKDADETTDLTDADSENGGDGIPDRYQVKILYVSADQTKGTVSPLEMEIKTIKDTNNNFVSKGTVTATGSTATVTDASLYEFVKWTKDTNEVGTNAQLKNYRIMDAEGGHTYIFTANFKDKKTEPPTSEKAQYTVKHYKWDTQKKNYTFDSEETINSTVGTDVTATAKTYDGGYILNEQKSAQTMSGIVLKDNTLTLKLYYDIDKIGSGENKDQPDGIPDRYQVTINYVSSNTNWGSVSPLSKEVITLKNGENLVEEATITTTASTATSAGGRCYFVNWTKKQEGTTDVSTVTPSANLTAQTFNAKGGDVYTFTANFDRSSGGGSGGSNRPKPPVVEIPDDVPTGLNGKDHYAYIIGYGNNDVRPQNNITRAEVATIFFRLLTDETREANMTKSNGYNDVKDGDWFCCAVSTLSKMGIIKGYEDGSFKPNDPISRAEFAAIAARFDPDGDKTPASFFDVTSHWAKDEISIAANHGWIKGYEDGSFKPDQKITRAETMTLVNRVLNRLPETKDDLHKDMKTWVDNMDETAWYYLAVQEATNSHYFKNKTGTKFEQWTELRDTRDWSELEK